MNLSNEPKKALIIGITGQDGSYLAKLLLEKGYTVHGTSRYALGSSFFKFKFLEIEDQVQVEPMSLINVQSVIEVISRIQPDEIYNLAGQSSVGLSFEQPIETFESIVIGTLNILEALRFLRLSIRFYNASSSECFGNTNGSIATESTPFRPRSPYAVAKAAAFWQVANYREAYDLYACSGILFNHESPLRSERFVTRKIIKTVVDIVHNRASELKLGNIDIERDWGWAPEYVEAMWLMLQQENPDDYIVATGKTYSLRDFITHAFSYFGLDWERYTTIDHGFLRPTDIQISQADTSKAEQCLGWSSKSAMPEVVCMMIEAEI